MIENLSQRDKTALIAGAAILFLLLIVFGVIAPYRSGLENLDRKIVSRQNQLNEARQLQQDYLSLQRELSRRQNKLDRNGQASAFSSIEAIVSRLGIRDKLVAMQPQPVTTRGEMQIETVAARIERIDLAQLVGLLRAFESSQTLLNVTSMQIRRRFDDPSQINAELKIETPKSGS